MRDLIFIGLIQEPVTSFHEHMHAVWEIVYYTHGTGIIKVGKEHFPFQPKTIVCLPPETPHSEHSDSGYCNYHYLVQSFNHWEDKVFLFADNGSGDFFTILKQMYIEFHKKQLHWRNITESLLNVLYQYITIWHSSILKNPMVERFENILVSNISNPLFNLEENMKKVPLSKDHFRKVFKNMSGKTPLQYLTEMRLEYAKKLLESNGNRTLKVMEIARMAGYDDPYYFSRVFKKHTGKAPIDWDSTHIMNQEICTDKLVEISSDFGKSYE